MDITAYDTLPEAELIDRINRARREKNAIILAHNYQPIEIQQLADHCGDSLELARIAARTDADMVVFCGVDFMAESAKILSPDKTVLIPNPDASCPMAHMTDPEDLAREKAANPDAVVVAYVNSTAAVKALTDVCCTSANAVNVVNSLGDREIIFVPDKNLAAYTASETGANIRPWDGFCHVHNNMTVEDVRLAREARPDAVLLIHPEAPPEVVALADKVLSTSGMERHVAAIDDPDEKRRGVILGTEVGLTEKLLARHPDINIWSLRSQAVCHMMKLISVPRLCWSIETGNCEVTLPDEVMIPARAALERMIEIS
jgi:quinolinate synthase